MNKKVLFVVLFLFLFPLFSYAASSVQELGCTTYPPGYGAKDAIRECTFLITASEVDGSVADYMFYPYGCIFKVTTNPGDVAPTALYDIELLYEGTIDAADGALHDRSATASERVYINPKPECVSSLTLHMTNNSVQSAVVVMKIWSGR